MPRFDFSDPPQIGGWVRSAMPESVEGLLNPTTAWPVKTLNSAARELGLVTDESADEQLLEITQPILEHLRSEDTNWRDIRNAVDNLQYLLTTTLLITSLQDREVIDGSVIAAAYRMTCPVYPCLGGNAAGGIVEHDAVSQ